MDDLSAAESSEEDGDWAHAVTLAINEGRFVEGMGGLIAHAVQSAEDSLRAAVGDFTLRIHGRDEAERFAHVVYALADFAKERLDEAEAEGGYEKLDELAAAAYTLRHCANYVHVLREPVPNSAGFPEYRARLLVAGWIAGEAHAALNLTREGVIRKAVQWDWQAQRRDEGRKAGNRSRSAQKQRWETKLRDFAIQHLANRPDDHDSDVIQAYAKSGNGLPISAAQKIMRNWRRDGTLPLSPSQRRKMEPNSGPQ